MPNLNIPIDPGLHRRLRIAAASQGRRMTDIVREAVEQWLDQQDQQHQDEVES